MLQKIMALLMPPKKMIELFTVKEISKQEIEKIIPKVGEALEMHKFSLLQTFVYHEIVESKGFPIQRKVYIYEICQAKVAAMMLTDNPEFSIFMPCKIAIYENEGNTVISTMNMEIMLNAVKGNKKLYTEALSLFKTLTALLNTLAKDS